MLNKKVESLHERLERLYGNIHKADKSFEIKKPLWLPPPFYNVEGKGAYVLEVK